MTKAYKYSILYFLAFSLLLIISGTMLFEHKIGFSPQSVNEYYMGNSQEYIPAKTPSGILKIVLPHIFAFGLFTMVILHFLVFTKERNSFKSRLLIYLTFISAFLEISTPFLIIGGVEFFAYFKIISFVLFESLILYSAWLLFRSIMQD